MHRLLLDLPERIETERLYLRRYEAGDGPWYCQMSQKNKSHLARYESDNPVMSINTEAEAEITVRDFAADWVARKAFFMGAFKKDTDEFVAQIYVGVVNWDLPEFEVGYFADAEHEGQGFVTEATKGALRFCFRYLGASRVSLRCAATNERSWRVAERCGMTREGCLREAKKDTDGNAGDTFLYGLLRREFQDPD
jgi:[ribosomal protein S5]-alanine N-acetyltransferase